MAIVIAVNPIACVWFKSKLFSEGVNGKMRTYEKNKVRPQIVDSPLVLQKKLCIALMLEIEHFFALCWGAVGVSEA